MNRPASIGRALSTASLLAMALCSTGRAQTTGATTGTGATYTWTGSSNSDFTNTYNWQGGVVPASDGTNTIAFSSTISNGAELKSDFSANGLTFAQTSTVSPWISSGGSSTLTIGSGGIVLSGSPSVTLSNMTVNLASNQTWNVASGSIYVGANLAGSGMLTVTGTGSLYLNDSNSSTGGISVQGASLSLGSSTSLGSGTLILGEGSKFNEWYGSASYSNPLELHSNVTFTTNTSGGRNTITFSGPVTLAGSASATQPFAFTTSVTTNSVVNLTGALSGVSGAASTNLTLSGGGILILSGTTGSEFSGFTASGTSALVFASSSALPATATVSATGGGIIGISGSNSLLTAVLAGITSPSTFNGTLSLDTQGTGGPNTYTGALNLASFTSGSVSLGSLSSATIGSTSVITPPLGSGFTFGNGGGRLVVQAPLIDPLGATVGSTGLTVSSNNNQPLTLVLQGANTFTGNVSVSHSYLVLDGSAALPTNAAIFLGTSGYVSSTPNWNSGTPSFLINAVNKTSYDGTSVIGFDSAAPATQSATVVGNIELNQFATSLYLGTTTHGLTIDATDVIRPAADGILKFAALQGGSFIINADLSSLNGVNSLVFGHTDTYLVNGISNAGSGSYQLGGNNTYTGGTTINNGSFTLSSSSPFGTGSISIASSAGKVALDPKVAVTFNQNISANNSKLILGDSGGAAALTLAGTLTGTTQVTYAGTVNLLGVNAYTGGSVIDTNTTVNVANNVGLGTGSIEIGSGGTSGTNPASTIVFGSSATSPVLGPLDGMGTIVLPSTATLLTINQGSSSTTFNGIIEAKSVDGTAIDTSAQLVIANTAGQGSFALAGSGANLYTGGTLVNSGKIRIQNTSSQPLGSSNANLTLTNATLSLEQGISGSAVTVPNPIVIPSGSTSTITGRGTLLAPGGATVDSSLIIAPGFSTDDSATEALVWTNTSDHSSGENLGTLTFGSSLAPTNLTFASGGTLATRIEDPTLAAGVGYGTLAVNGSINLSATALQPFNIKLYSGGKGGGNDSNGSNVNIVFGNTYSLVLASATQGITNFDANALKLDLTNLSIPSSITITNWSFSLGNSNTELLLNFVPVPEPETWVMLGFGAFAAFVPLLRRRSSRRR